MSGIFPSTISPTSVEIESVQPTLVSVANSGKRQARYAGGHLWSISLNFPVMRRFEFEPINAFIMSQNGSVGSFQYTPPNKATPLGVASGSPVVASLASAEDTTIDLTVPASITGYLKAGDIFKFASHSKVYLCTADVDSTVGGVATVNFMPPLVVDVAALVAVDLTDVQFTVYVEDSHSYKTAAPNFSSYKVKLMESL